MTSLVNSNNHHHHHHHHHASSPIPLQINPIPPNPQPTPSIDHPPDNHKKPNLDYFRDPFMPTTAPKNISTAASRSVLTAKVAASTSAASMAIDGSEEDSVLSKSEYLTRDEVLRRRSRRLKQLAKVYKDHYWSLMDELKLKYREYYWEYGKSPFLDDEERDNSGNNQGLGLGGHASNNAGSQCAVHGCKSKAMALTKFCHTHILSDANQKLYIGCNYVIKSSQAGPITCGKPILRSTVPSLCPLHFQKAEKHVARALKKAGLNVNSTSKLAPKFHVIVAEYVNQIQTKRRAALREATNNSEKEEEISI